MYVLVDLCVNRDGLKNSFCLSADVAGLSECLSERGCRPTFEPTIAESVTGYGHSELTC